MRTRRSGAILMTFVVLALVLGACSSNEGGGGTTAASSGYDDSEARGSTGEGGGSAGYDAEDPLGEPDLADDPIAARPPSTVGLDSNVIKTATLKLEVKNDEFQDAVDESTATAEKHGGFIVTSTVEDGDEGRGTIILRVPSHNFGVAMSELQDLGDIMHQSVTGQDVTANYIDLRARLRHRRAQEAAMLKLLEEPISVDETIRVRSQLDEIQIDIERLRGELRVLNDQTSLATIEVSIIEAGAVPKEAGEIQKAWARATATSVVILSGLITTLGVVVPLAIVLAIVLLVIAKLRPRLSSWQSPP